MRIWPISDLHFRTRDALDLVKPTDFPEADVCVLAGDVCDSVNAAINWVGKVIRPRMPVVWVLGNHEFYGSSVTSVRHNARLIANALGVTLLDDDAAVIDGVRFVGGTLWTDYALYCLPEDDAATRKTWTDNAMKAARLGISDHSQIDASDVVNGIIPRQFSPRDALAMHEVTASFIDRTLAVPHDGPTVVVTHHAPHPGSIAAKYAGDPLTPAFVSDLTGLIERRKPELWVHGHVHDVFDYRVGDTRIVCNPRGYADENRAFEWKKVIEVGEEHA